jgi:ParB family chromosome partitioning protein
LALAKRLGRGLDALIPSLNIDEDDKVIQIPLNQIRVNPYQPRKHFDEEAILELAQSIKEHGVIQPIIVRQTIKDYEIIAGERRFRASKASGATTIPAVVKKFTDRQVMEIALIENLQREDLNAMEISVAYQKLMKEFELTQEELALKVGKSRPHVANFLRLLQLPDEVQEYVSRGTLSMGHARALLGIKDQREWVPISQKVIKEEWSVRQLEQYIQNQAHDNNSKKTSEAPKKKINLYQRHYEERLTESLGTSVKIKLKDQNKGKIEIDFFSSDDLQRIIELLEP